MDTHSIICARLEFGVFPATDQKVIADVDRSRQILINLLNNAVKFSPTDGHIDLRVVETEGFITIEVADTGKGIPADRLESVFEPFVQLEADTATRSGFGLGLAISRKLAELMGGSLRVRSEPGEGSCFVLSLRRAP